MLGEINRTTSPPAMMPPYTSGTSDLLALSTTDTFLKYLIILRTALEHQTLEFIMINWFLHLQKYFVSFKYITCLLKRIVLICVFPGLLWFSKTLKYISTQRSAIWEISCVSHGISSKIMKIYYLLLC